MANLKDKDVTRQALTSNFLRFKWQVYCALEDIPKGNMAAKFFGIMLLVLIVINALLEGVVITGIPDEMEFLYYFLVFSAIAFFLEWVGRIWIANMVYNHKKIRYPHLHYLFSPLGIVDFLSFSPAILLLFMPENVFITHVVWIIRLMRLIKVSRYMSGLKAIGDVFKKRSPEIIASFMVLGLFALVSSILMFEVEYQAQPDVFNSVFTGLYWAIQTMTSTGYGDVVPITPLGRIIGFFTMAISIGVIAIPAGIFSAGFIEEFRKQDKRAKKEKIAQKFAEDLQSQDKLS